VSAREPQRPRLQQGTLHLRPQWLQIACDLQNLHRPAAAEAALANSKSVFHKFPATCTIDGR